MKITVPTKQRTDLTDFPLEMFVWTYFSAPFAMGGTHRAKKAKFPAREIAKVDGIKLGQQQEVLTLYEFALPNYLTGICIANGAIVGRDIQQVIKDIESTTLKMLAQQVEEADKVAAGAAEIDLEKFEVAYMNGIKQQQT